MKTILVTGGSGMVGRTLKDLINNDINKWIFLSSKDCDLTYRDQVNKLFEEIKPDHVIHLAANVGGLYKNIRERVSMFKDNVRMNENVLEACNNYGIQKAIFCLSSCIYPHKPSKYPMDETMIHDSEPHPSNEGYGYSKRMMELQCRSYNKQFNRQYICLIPVNLYGPYDNFNLEDSHVIPGLIHRLLLAKKNNENFQMYGTGKPLRQFIHSKDFCKILIKCLNTDIKKNTVICSDGEISIKDLTLLIAKKIGYDLNKISNDESKSDGCLRKTVKSIYFDKLFPDFKYMKLEVGIEDTISWFKKNYDNCRK